MTKKFVLATLAVFALAVGIFAVVGTVSGGPAVADEPFQRAGAVEVLSESADLKASGILICFPWYDVGCNVEGRCFSECADKTLRVRACQVCTSTGCTFSHYETSCSELFCS